MKIESRFSISRIASIALLGCTALGLTACGTGQPSLVGVWQGDDSTRPKTISDDGTCTGMYYNAGQPLDIGGRATCTLGDAQDSNGHYLLVVRQSPNERSYRVDFIDDDTVVLMDSTGKTVVTLERQ